MKGEGIGVYSITSAGLWFFGHLLFQRYLDEILRNQCRRTATSSKNRAINVYMLGPVCHDIFFKNMCDQSISSLHLMGILQLPKTPNVCLLKTIYQIHTRYADFSAPTSSPHLVPLGRQSNQQFLNL